MIPRPKQLEMMISVMNHTEKGLNDQQSVMNHTEKGLNDQQSVIEVIYKIMLTE